MDIDTIYTSLVADRMSREKWGGCGCSSAWVTLAVMLYLACFDGQVNETTITEIAKQKPYYFIMRDSSLANDNVADNFEQIFNHYSKDTVRRIL